MVEESKLTFMRYSTARWGLLKLARNALMTGSFGNPIDTISLMLVSSAEPARNELDESPSFAVVVAASPLSAAAVVVEEAVVFEGAGV